MNVTVWTQPAVKNITELKFEIGKTNVTYYAQDVFQNDAKCSFHVTVKGRFRQCKNHYVYYLGYVADEEPPVIENCENLPVFLSSDPNGANLTWDEPNIFDNSQKVKVQKYDTYK